MSHKSGSGGGYGEGERPLARRTDEHPIAPALAQRGREYAQRSSASSTRTQYQSDLRAFVDWCAHQKRAALPANWETVRAYITDMADRGYAWSTIRQHMSAISQAHEALEADRKVAGIPDEVENPCEHHRVRQTAKGIRRSIKVAPNKKRAILASDLELVLGAITENGLVALRDTAILLLGFAGGFRRAELAALEVEDLERRPEGIIVRIRSSKANQEGRAEYKAIPKSAQRTIAALACWLDTAGITKGPIFRSAWVDGTLKPHRMSGRDVGRMVVRRLVRAGLMPPLRELRRRRERNPFGAHSLRSGFITQSHREGKPLADIMKQTGQRSVNTLMGYIQKEDLFQNNAADGVAL